MSPGSLAFPSSPPGSRQHGGSAGGGRAEAFVIGGVLDGTALCFAQTYAGGAEDASLVTEWEAAVNTETNRVISGTWRLQKTPTISYESCAFFFQSVRSESDQRVGIRRGFSAEAASADSLQCAWCPPHRVTHQPLPARNASSEKRLVRSDQAHRH